MRLEIPEGGTPEHRTMNEERQLTVINQSLTGQQRSSLSEIHLIFLADRSQLSHPGHNHATGDSQYDGFIHKEIL